MIITTKPANPNKGPIPGIIEQQSKIQYVNPREYPGLSLWSVIFLLLNSAAIDSEILLTIKNCQKMPNKGIKASQT
tara:strand:- start:325 stop:552 length:228 start_codon:yes stop_codon:yes gene_type:complete